MAPKRKSTSSNPPPKARRTNPPRGKTISSPSNAPSRTPSQPLPTPPPTSTTTTQVAIVPNDQTDHGFQFENSEHKRHFESIHKKKLVATSYMDDDCLKKLGLYDGVCALLQKVGCLQFFLKLRFTTHRWLTFEFFSSLQSDLFDGRDVVNGTTRFWLFDQTHEMSLQKFNELLTLSPSGARQPPRHFNSSLWSDITYGSGRYDPSQSKISQVCNHCLCYVARLISDIILGQGTSDEVLSRKLLYLLGAMLGNYKVDVGAHILSRMKTLKNAAKGTIVMGGLITALAMRMGFESQVLGLPSGLKAHSLDLKFSLRTDLIALDGFDYYVVNNGNKLFRLPDRTHIDPLNPANRKYRHDVDKFVNDNVVDTGGEQAPNQENTQPPTSSPLQFVQAESSYPPNPGITIMDLHRRLVEVEDKLTILPEIHKMLADIHKWHIDHGYPPPPNSQ